MKIMKCNEEFVASMCNMPSSSHAQNEALRNEIKEGLSLDCCFIKAKKGHVVCRAIVYEAMHYVGYVTVEDISQDEVDAFIIDVGQQLDTSSEWRCDLYSDKIHYERIHNALGKQFKTEIKRASYTCEIEKCDLNHACFVSALQLCKEDVISLMIRASESTLDQLIQREIHQLDVVNVMRDMYDELVGNAQSDSLFQVLYIEHHPVGFIAINELAEGVGGIGYIGVEPKYQGHHYSTILLEKGKYMAYQKKIYKLIGDVDEQNFAIRHNLLAAGFEKVCIQCVFLR